MLFFNSFSHRIRFTVAILLLVSSGAFAQDWRSGWVYIQNVETGLVVDIKGNNKSNGVTAWPYTLNYTEAQMFQFSQYHIPDRFGENTRYIMAYDGSSYGSDFYLTIKTPADVLANPVEDPPDTNGTGIQRPTLEQPATGVFVDPDRPVSTKKTLRNFKFTIEGKRDLEASSNRLNNTFAVEATSTPKQVWTLLPVGGEPDTYYIQSAHFDTRMVMEPLDYSSGGTLVLSSFTGTDIQKWKITKTKPRAATNLNLSNFKWDEELDQSPWYKPWEWHHDQSVRGELSWSAPSGLAKQSVRVASSDATYDRIPVSPNDRSLNFNLDSNTAAKHSEHCFTVTTQSIWPAQNRAFSDEFCRKPTFDEDPEPPPIEPPGIGTLLVENCHSNRESVHLWTYDLTENNGAWKDHGSLASQWSDSRCPTASPKEIEIEDDHIYTFVAIDCGSSPPNASQSSCHRLTSAPFQGEEDGGTIRFQVN